MKKQKKEYLSEIIRNFRSRRIAVVGDLMLDTYTWGKVSRISPEAPVPIVRTVKTTSCLGGAANVMRNIVSLGGTVHAFGVIGDDVTGKQLTDLLEKDRIGYSGIVKVPGRPTIRKQRIIAGSQQLLRIDDELPGDICDGIREDLLSRIKTLFADEKVDALILEDYAKGLFSEKFAQDIINVARAEGIPVSLDPNPGNPMRLKGLTIMKPNRSEAFELAGIKLRSECPGDDLLAKAAEAIRKEWDVKYLLISLAEQGMALFAPDGNMIHIPTRAKEVYDVSGAGDTVIAASTLALCVRPDDPAAAAEIANYAAGIVVGKLGTAAVSLEELFETLS